MTKLKVITVGAKVGHMKRDNGIGIVLTVRQGTFEVSWAKVNSASTWETYDDIFLYKE